ncbi:MAG: TIGR03086 family metal-binding protein [Acidimicrobiales bacterium]
MTPADRYRLVSSQFDRLLADVPADRWDAPSPCDGWSARQVVQHVVDTEAELLGRMGFDAPAVDGVDPLEAWPLVRAAVSAALADPARAGYEYDGYFGRTTFERTVDDFYSFDLVVHRWDVAHATGLSQHEQIDDDELGRLCAGAEHFGDAMRMPGVFGPEVPAPADATPQERFLAWIGRDPRG